MISAISVVTLSEITIIKYFQNIILWAISAILLHSFSPLLSIRDIIDPFIYISINTTTKYFILCIYTLIYTLSSFASQTREVIYYQIH